jgi:hypothetical protein
MPVDQLAQWTYTARPGEGLELLPRLLEVQEVALDRFVERRSGLFRTKEDREVEQRA